MTKTERDALRFAYLRAAYHDPDMWEEIWGYDTWDQIERGIDRGCEALKHEQDEAGTGEVGGVPQVASD